jgi:intracellular multiplication protein IcmE
MSDVQENTGIKRVLRDRGSKKFLMFIGAAVVIVVLVFVFKGGSRHVETSQVTPPPPGAGAQGGAPVSREYGRQLEQSDRQRTEQAIQTGTSSTPTPRMGGTQQGLSNNLLGEDERGRSSDTIERPLSRQVVAPQPNPQPAPVVMQVAPMPIRQPVDPGLIALYQKQIQALMKNDIEVPRVTFLNAVSTSGNGLAQTQGGSQQQTSQSRQNNLATNLVQQASGGSMGTQRMGQQFVSDSSQASTVAQSRFIPPVAGSILYSRLIGEVNSDIPGPVLATIMQGPFSGARLLGNFETTEEGVIITFTSMTVAYDEDGEQKSELVPIRAVAVDPSKLGTAMATDIDRHLLMKIAVAFGTSFLQGFGAAISQSGSTATINPLGGTTIANPILNTRQQLAIGAGQGAQQAGNIFQQYWGNRKTTVTVDAGTPFGLLFLGTNQ